MKKILLICFVSVLLLVSSVSSVSMSAFSSSAGKTTKIISYTTNSYNFIDELNIRAFENSGFNLYEPPNSVPPIVPGNDEITSEPKLDTFDDNYFTTNTIENRAAYHLFSIDVQEDEDFISNMGLHWKGRNYCIYESYEYGMHLWNYATNSWELMDSLSIPKKNVKDYHLDLTEDYDEYLGGGNSLHFLVWMEKASCAGFGKPLATDSFEMTITHHTPTPCDADFNQDGIVDLNDFKDFAGAYGHSPEGENAKFDLNSDGEINQDDFVIFKDFFGQSCNSHKVRTSYSSKVLADSAFARMIKKNKHLNKKEKFEMFKVLNKVKEYKITKVADYSKKYSVNKVANKVKEYKGNKILSKVKKDRLTKVTNKVKEYGKTKVVDTRRLKVTNAVDKVNEYKKSKIRFGQMKKTDWAKIKSKISTEKIYVLE